MHWSKQTPSSNNTIENSTHGHHQMVNTEIRLIIFFVAEDREALHGQQKEDWSWLWLRPWTPSCKIQTKIKKVEKTTRSFRYDLNWISYNYIVEVTNRFKGLDLIDRVPEALSTKVHNIVQEEVIKTIPEKNKCKKGNLIVWGGLKNSCEKKRSERKRRKGNIYPSESKVPKNSKERLRRSS